VPATGLLELPTVDVIVNNWNYGRFLRHSIDSALEQTHPGVSVIAVDDGSTDHSRTVLAAYGDRILSVCKENGGQASALNAGFGRSTGDVVIFLDADDMLAPEAAELAARAFDADPGLVKVQCRMEVVDAAGRRTGLVKPARHVPLPQGDCRRKELTSPFDLAWSPNGASAFSAEALRRILPMPEDEFARCADWYVVHLSALLGLVASVDVVGAFYRVHGRNLHEPQGTDLDLRNVRQAVLYAAATTAALERTAGALELELPYGRILSVADLSNRLVSLKLAPQLHPLDTDRAVRLALDGVRAASRRFDVSWPLRLVYACWFLAMTAAPRPLARRLAELLLFPQRRRDLNRLLGRLHRTEQTEALVSREN
jgi:glycosyltransferase involved in cell wall biosynthesis